jgi:hypothetical protein
LSVVLYLSVFEQPASKVFFSILLVFHSKWLFILNENRYDVAGNLIRIPDQELLRKVRKGSKTNRRISNNE